MTIQTDFSINAQGNIRHNSGYGAIPVSLQKMTNKIERSHVQHGLVMGVGKPDDLQSSGS